MENITSSPARKINLSSSNNLFFIVLIVSAVLGVLAGYLLANSAGNTLGSSKVGSIVPGSKPATAQADKNTFRDFAEGKVSKKPEVKGKQDQYGEGTHLLIREGASPVALTSSVVDLSQYEGKQVKVYGETQKALKEGWLMDVGLVEVK